SSPSAPERSPCAATSAEPRFAVVSSTGKLLSPRNGSKSRFHLGSVRVQGGVELDAAATGTGAGLEGSTLGVGEEQDPIRAGQLRRFDHGAVRQLHLAAGGDVGARGDHA